MNLTIGLPTKKKQVVCVVIHKTLAMMRQTIRKMGHENPDACIATCFDCKPCHSSPVIAQIHLCRQRIDPFVIVHESSHAAIHAAKHDEHAQGEAWEEQVAYSTSTIAHEIIQFCVENKICLSCKQHARKLREEEEIMQRLSTIINAKTAILN